MTPPHAAEDDPRAVLEAHIRQTMREQDWDINAPYFPQVYHHDLCAIIIQKPGRPGQRAEHRFPDTGHRHIIEADGDDLRLRIYQHCRATHGDPLGGGRALRFIALLHLWRRIHARLAAHGLNWMPLDFTRTDSDATLRTIDCLRFLLRYRVPKDRQFHPDCIPDEALDEFLRQEAGAAEPHGG